MRRALLILPFLLLLAGPAAVLAGGFATTGLSSTPNGLRAGEQWKVELTILQHGRTPLAGLSPRIVTRDVDGIERSFAASPTRRDGVYAATVTFSRPGPWSYTVYDGFNDAMPTTFPSVMIREPGATAPAVREPDPVGPWFLPLALAGALAVAVGVVLLRRRRHPPARLA